MAGFQIYRSDDAGAPSIAAVGGTTPIITLLDACLVNGYGSKPALGWTKPFSSSNIAAYLMGGTGPKGYLRVDQSTASSAMFARVRGFAAMSDINTGTDPFPTDAQLNGGGYFHIGSGQSATIRPWMLYGNERFFYIHMWGAATGAALTNTAQFSTTSYQFSGFFGGFISNVAGDNYPFVLQASVNASNAGDLSTAAGIAASIGGLFTARNYLQQANTSRALAKTIYGIGTTNSTLVGGPAWAPYPNPITNDLGLWPGMLLFEGTGVNTSIRGRTPAFFAPMNNLTSPIRHFETLSDSSGNQYLIVPETHVIAVQTSPVHPDWALN